MAPKLPVIDTSERVTIDGYVVTLAPGEDGMVFALVHGILGCQTQGKTREEALANAREAIAASKPDETPQSCGCPDAPAEASPCVYDDELGNPDPKMCRCCARCAHDCYQNV